MCITVEPVQYTEYIIDYCSILNMYRLTEAYICVSLLSTYSISALLKYNFYASIVESEMQKHCQYSNQKLKISLSNITNKYVKYIFCI